MKIAIDAFETNFEERVGMGPFVYNLIKALAKIDSQNGYTLYMRKTLKKRLNLEQKNFHLKTLRSFSYRTLWTQARLPIELFFHKPEILHMPTGHKIPPYRSCKTIVTIHDLAFLMFKDYFRPSHRWRSMRFARYAVKHADKIIAISDSTKKDIVNFYHVPPERITVIYHGYEDNLYKPVNDIREIKRIRKKYNINTDYILYLGMLQPRKNLSRLMEAFGSLIKNINRDYQLVIAGKKGWLYEEIFKTAKTLNLGNKIIFTGYVPEEELPLLMSGAKLFVLPSLYEGFGIPLLEAMACGTPVITSNISSLPEVVGEAGLLFDPYNENEITKVMSEILLNENLRKLMIEKGLKRVKLFSWEKAASQTISVYEEVYKNTK